MSNQVATTILQQLGGNRFIAMTGARRFVACADALIFAIPGNGFAKQGINRVTIKLTADDLYTVEFLRQHGATCKPIASFEGLFADQLQPVFTDVTGLNTRL